MTKKIINISIEKKINNNLESKKINKSKLINFLISEFFEKEGDIENFKKK